MKLSVIILNYNVYRFLELCIQSVKAAIRDLDAEIIVVDNNSPDDSCAMVEKKFPEITLLKNTENSGFSKGNNQGVSIAKGEYICILNPDTVVSEHTFSALLNFADSQKNVGIIGCKLIDGKGTFLPESKRNIPKPIVAIKKKIGNSKCYYANDVKENDIAKVSVFVGAFMLIKKEVYTKVNGFDEDYFMYGEDIDLSYKVLKLGLNNYYVGTATIIHYKGESTLKNKIYAKRFYGAMQIFYKKHFKKNVIFDVLVWIGIKIIPFFNTEKKSKATKPNAYVLISKTRNEQLQKALKPHIEIQNKINDYQSHTEYILDSNYMSFNDIIKTISLNKNPTTTFKILPKNTNYIIGSNSSKNRGEVIYF